MKEFANALIPSSKLGLSFGIKTVGKQQAGPMLGQTHSNSSSLETMSHVPMSAVVDHRSVSSILKSRILSPLASSDPDAEDAFYVADLGEVVRQHTQWKELLPRVEPFYAIKCNPDPLVIRTLASLGTGFDCASKGEIEMVMDAGVDPSRVIYANPCKQTSHIRHANNRGVKVMTFDNADELVKVKQIMPDAKMVLRILTDDSRSVCRFGVKFGASLSVVPSLLRKAIELNIEVIGISFHVGSGCFDASAFADAVALARKAFDIGKALGFDFQLLDVGGGFPGRNNNGLQFPDIAAVLGPAIDHHFPDSNVHVIAEPGRYFVSSAFTLAVNIVARRVVPRDANTGTTKAQDANAKHESDLSMDTVSHQDGDEVIGNDHPFFMYYINEGMYGSFNCITFDHAVVKAQPLVRGGKFLYTSTSSQDAAKATSDTSLFPCSIWGPTCDSIDCIGRDCVLPQMNVGDWLYFANMGAYTVAAASPFNGFKLVRSIYTDTAQSS